MKHNPHSHTTGSVLVWTVLTLAILSLFATEVLRAVSGRFQLGVQAATWQEGLIAAESGVDLAVVELRKSLYPPPNHAWEGWTNIPGNGVISHGLTTVPNAGLAGTPMNIEVDVDAPAQLIGPPPNGWQYYRIRTLGTIPLTGPPRVGYNKQDNELRKLTLRSQRFIDTLFTSETSAPHAARRIEAIVQPLSAFSQAILAVGTLDLNNQNIVVDSYDSRDPAKSTNGLYDPLKRQQDGDIATDGSILDASGAHVYGDVSTNSGTATGVANVTGVQRTDFYQAPIPIGAPAWPSINPSPSTVTTTTTLTALPTKGAPLASYVLSAITLSGTQNLTLAGNPDGISQTYIEIYVTGNISTTGNAQITVAPGVSATIYFKGNVDIAGNGMINSNNQPGDLLLYGVNPDPGVTPHVNLGGNGQITAAVYAPGDDVTINGGGNSGHVFGSVVGKTVTMTGVTNLHYDEALSSGGLTNNYKIVSWFEDTR
jgi:hypothetical protein